MKAKCERCYREFNFGEGRIDLSCQKCGSSDLTFDSDLVMVPVAPGGNLGPSSVYIKGDKFSGAHKFGSVWEVKKAEIVKDIPKVSRSSELDSIDNEKLKEKLEEEKLEEGNKELKEEKPSLLRATKKLRTKIGTD